MRPSPATLRQSPRRRTSAPDAAPASAAPDRRGPRRRSRRETAPGPRPRVGPSPGGRDRVTVGNTKGGVGKTTLATQLALAWAIEGRDVLLVVSVARHRAPTAAV